MEMKMDKKVAIITGSVQGIGKAIAEEFARRGFVVVLNNFMEDEQAHAAVKDIEALGAEAFFVKADVSKFDEASALIDTVKEKYGRIDVLVNNAGITRDGLIMRMTEQEFDAVISVNLKGTFNCCKFIAPVMLKQKFGKIINIASIVGVIGNAGQANYCASKAGIIGLTKSLSKELGSRGITVNAIAPGFIETAMTAQLPEKVVADYMARIPLKRFGKAEDIANVAAFLASSDADYISGQVIAVDGALS